MRTARVRVRAARYLTVPIPVDEPVDAVVHFASPASPDRLPGLPVQTLKVGSLGTHNALGPGRRKSARFLLASTSEVYGDPLVHPQPETYWGNVNPIGPRGVYDEAKRFAEAMTMAYRRRTASKRASSGSSTPTARGCARRRARVPTFIGQALRRRADDGLRRRLARPAASATSATWSGARSPSRHASTPVNIGNPREFTDARLAVPVLELTGSAARWSTPPARRRPAQVRRPDITLASTELGWKPEVGLWRRGSGGCTQPPLCSRDHGGPAGRPPILGLVDAIEEGRARDPFLIQCLSAPPKPPERRAQRLRSPSALHSPGSPSSGQHPPEVQPRRPRPPVSAVGSERREPLFDVRLEHTSVRAPSPGVGPRA